MISFRQILDDRQTKLVCRNVNFWGNTSQNLRLGRTISRSLCWFTELLKVTLANKHSFSLNSVNVLHLHGKHAQAGFVFLNTFESPTVNGSEKSFPSEENKPIFRAFGCNSKWSQALLTLERFRFPVLKSCV